MKEKLQILSNTNKHTLTINSCFPMDYSSLRIDLLDSIGNETETIITVKSHAVNTIEIQLPELLKGIFQVRIRDINNYLVQKIIIQ